MLAGCHDVTLAVEGPPQLKHDSFEVIRLTTASLRRLLPRTEVVVTQGYPTRHFPELRSPSAALVIDLYDAFHVETFESYKGESPGHRQLLASSALSVIREQLDIGDFFLCASEQQRLFWLGHLALLGRLTPAEHDVDPAYRRLIDVAPSGIPTDPPTPGAPLLKGNAPGIAGSDRIILWSGGIYDWLDPLTVIRAFARIAPDFPDTHLVFLGATNPHTAIPPQGAVARARALAEQLTVPRVHFHDDWVGFRQRGSILLEADIGVSAHPDTLEARLAVRTRLLDHIWAGVATVATSGEELAERMAAAGACATVPPGDIGAMATTLCDLLNDDSRRRLVAEAAQAMAVDFTWPRQLKRLGEFCDAPYLTRPTNRPQLSERRGRARYLARRLVSYGRAGEWRRALTRARSILRGS
jgi:glycosyltransferase involved in cell wall biosynthesis